MLKQLRCAGWHGASYSRWLYDTAGDFIRGGSEVFSFNNSGNGWNDSKICGRGVAVVKSAVRAERVTDDLCDGAECSVRHWTLIQSIRGGNFKEFFENSYIIKET